MRPRLLVSAALAALLLAGTAAPVPVARAQEECKSWSEARGAGWIEKFRLRPASEIKKDVERRHKGEVVNFVLCLDGGRVFYKLSVFQPYGNVVFVTEPAQ